MSEQIFETKLPPLNYAGATLTVTNVTGERGARMVELQALVGGWAPIARLTIDRATFVKVCETFLEHEREHGYRSP